MKLEAVRIKNFRAFKDVEMTDIPSFCVLVGANGVGKSTFFSIFGFLKDAMTTDVNHALVKIGGVRGFQEVRSRGCSGPIEFEIKFRKDPNSPLATYTLKIDEENGRAFVALEQLRYRRGSKGQPWSFLKFEKGVGYAVTNELDSKLISNENELTRDEQQLKSNDLLAIKALAQFQSLQLRHWPNFRSFR